MTIPKPPRLSILVVSYNTRDLTIACLSSIVRETKHVSYEIIVVDNASTDGSREAIADHPAKPNLIALGENIGFARANNLAARAAKGDLILLLNPDTEVRGGAIDKIAGFAARRPQSMLWGGRTIFPDGTLNPSSAWAKMTLWRLFCRASGLTGLFPDSAVTNGEAYGGWKRDSERAVDIVSGCFLLIDRELWTRLGGFDPLFFMYGEDADLCLRARLLGARPRVTPEATIVHYGGASERVREDKLVKLLAGKAMLIARHFPTVAVPVGLALQALWPLSRAAATLCLARWRKSHESLEAARIWLAVWKRREEWYLGYGDADTENSLKKALARRS